jgi:mRNA interferase HigB
MRIISRRTLREYWEKHSTAKPGLLLWYNRVSAPEFHKFNDLRQIFPYSFYPRRINPLRIR